MLIDKIFPFEKYTYIQISLFLCMHVQTNVGRISKKSRYPPWISFKYQKWYLMNIMMGDIMVNIKSVWYHPSWCLTFLYLETMLDMKYVDMQTEY
jgi:hypothetical protein